MNKKYLSIVGISTIVLLALVLFKSTLLSKGFDVTIRNNTDVTLTGLKITYEKITSDIDIPSVSTHKKVNINVLPTEDFSENAMKLYYIDKQGNRQEEYIVGYFEKGYRGKVIVDINSIDTNGKLTFKVKNSTSF